MPNDWDEADVPDLEPMAGCRPLDTYRGDCPCNGAIPSGSRLVCLKCHRSGFDEELWAARVRTEARRRRKRTARPEKLAEFAAEREAARRARKLIGAEPEPAVA